MAEPVFSIMVGVKLSVFIILLIYSILIKLIAKGKNIIGINLFALALIIIALVEFFEVTAELGESGKAVNIFNFISDIFTLVAGLGLLGFILHVNKNIKDYI